MVLVTIILSQSIEKRFLRREYIGLCNWKVQGKSGMVWIRDSKDTSVFMCLWGSVTQVYGSPYWYCSEADSSLEVRFTEPSFQSTSLSSLGKMGKKSPI